MGKLSLAAKITLPGPFTMSQQARDEFYKDPEALTMDMAAAVNEEIHDLVRAGADIIQLDEPWVRNDPEAARRYAVKAINRALEGVKVPTVVHLCFGYAAVVPGENKPHTYTFLAELAGTIASTISIESAQPKIDLGILKDLAPKNIMLGVLDLSDPNVETAETVAARIRRDKRAGDVCIFSIHWGPNWGYEIAEEDRAFAHELVEAGVDIVHGHSSHHPKAIEPYRGKLILYGCGDLINDYEGIENHEPYRDDHVLAYLATIDTADGRLTGLDMLPFRIRKFRLDRADAQEAEWLRATMDRECRRFGTGVSLHDGRLRLAL